MRRILLSWGLENFSQSNSCDDMSIGLVFGIGDSSVDTRLHVRKAYDENYRNKNNDNICVQPYASYGSA